jgi:lipopolysaccharide export LptBFGC system permease protein LptF
MRLISRHILRSLAAPFFWGVLALTGLLLLNQLAQLIDNFGGRGLGWDVMAEAIVLALPALLTLTLPMSVLVATLYAYSSLAADLEMVAMYANGLSVWRMVRPAFVAATFVAIVNFLLFDQLVPLSNTRFRTLRSDVFRKAPTLTLRPQQLNELSSSGYVLRAREISNADGQLREVTIWDLRRFDGRRVIHADSGRMAQSPDGTDLLMTLYDGEILDFSTVEPTRVERTAFHVNVVNIKDVQDEFERSDAQLERGDRERSGCELLDGITEGDWALEEAHQRREQLTRRDLRHLMALPPLPPPPVQPRPEFPPHCGQWREVQKVLERVLLPRTADASVATPSVALPSRHLAETDLELPPAARQSEHPTESDTEPPLAARQSEHPTESDIEPPLAAAQQEPVRLLTPQDSAAARRRLDSIRRFKDSTSRLGVTPDSEVVPQQQEPADSIDGVPLYPVQPQPPPFLVNPPGYPGGPADPGMATTMMDVSGARMQADEALRITREYAVEYHKKFAIPLGSFCFVLMGVALALKFPRSGIGLVIGGSLLIFLAFYVLLIGGESLADKGVVSAEVAMYLPVALFTLAGLAAVASANREMGTARTVGLGEWLRDLFRRRRAPS